MQERSRVQHDPSMSQAKKHALKSMQVAVFFSSSLPCHLAAGKVVSPVVHDVKQSKSVADARAVKGLCFYLLAFLCFAAGKAASPVAHDVKQS